MTTLTAPSPAMNVHQVIGWMQDHLRFMEASLPNAIERGSISAEHAAHKLACARANMNILVTVRAMYRGEELAHG